MDSLIPLGDLIPMSQYSPVVLGHPGFGDQGTVHPDFQVNPTTTPFMELAAKGHFNGVAQATEGIKYDEGKPRMELLEADWLSGVARVLTFGAKKYADNNWRKGFAITRLIGASLRHTFAFLRGEDLDPESGENHLYHASCCLMFASWLLKHRPELDDRYKRAA